MSKIKAPIAANSGSLGKIGNAEIGLFGLIAASHELIRGSLAYKFPASRHNSLLRRLFKKGKG